MDDFFLGVVISVLMAMLGLLAVSITLSNRVDLRFQVCLFLGAYAIRFAMSIVIYEFGLVNVLGDDDSSGWGWGIVIRDTWLGRGVGILELPVAMLEAFWDVNRGYRYWLATLFYVTNAPVRLAAASLGCLCGALTVVFSYRMACGLISREAAARVGRWACFFPSMVIWSAQTVKEPIVILLEVLAVYGCLQLRNNRVSARYIVLCLSSTVLLLTLRFYAAYLAAGVVLISLALPRLSRGARKIIPGLGVLVLALPLIYFSGAAEGNKAEFDRFSNLDNADALRRDLATTAKSSIEHKHDMKTPTGLLLGGSIGAVHLLLAPFPWQLGGASLRMLLTLPEVLVWWLLALFGVLPGLIYVIRARVGEFMPILLFILGLGVVYSITTGNIGLMYRQRTQFLPYFFIFAASHFERRAHSHSGAHWAIRPDNIEAPLDPIPAPVAR